jgi:shikimate dehydrogenase
MAPRLMGVRHEINAKTALCAVIGRPVGHSLSPAMHNAAFEAAGLNYVYLAFEVEDVAACLTGMRALPNFRGLSVTIPHKLAVMQHLDEIDPMARRVGSVNTITNDKGRLVGTTTDGLGTLRAFEDAGIEIAGKNVLFLGSGGAVRSVAFAFAERARPARLCILGRTAEKVSALATDLENGAGMTVQTGALDSDLERAMGESDIVVQGTSVGMHGHDEGETIVPAAFLRPGQAIFDMVYRPLKTRLIREAEAAGCRTILGLEMLVNQAVLQFEAWTGVAAPRAVMRDALLRALQ